MIMKKTGNLIPIILFCILFLNACEKDYLAPQTATVIEINFPVSFATNIVPILNEDCAKATCHVAGGHTPDLTPAKAYNELTLLGYVDPNNAEGSTLYRLITASTKPMPPSGRLNGTEIGLIKAWINQGAQNN
jgi:hypothetical protein